MEDEVVVLMDDDLDDETSKFLAMGKRYFNKRAKSYVDVKYDTSSSNYKLKVVLSDEWNALKMAEKLSYSMMAHKDKLEKSNAKKNLKQTSIEKEKNITQMNLKIIDKAIGGMKSEKRHIVPICLTPLSIETQKIDRDPFDNVLESHFFFDFPSDSKEELPRFTRFVKSVSISNDLSTTSIHFKTINECKKLIYGDDLQPLHSQVECLELPISILKKNINKQSSHFAQSLKNEKRLVGSESILFSSYAFWVQREKDIVLRSISWEPQVNVAKDKILQRIKNENKEYGNMQLIDLLICFGVKMIDSFVYSESEAEKCKMFAHKEFQALMNVNPMDLLTRFFQLAPNDEDPQVISIENEPIDYVKKRKIEYDEQFDEPCEHLVFDEDIVFDRVKGRLSEQVTVEYLPDGVEALETDQTVVPFF